MSEEDHQQAARALEEAWSQLSQGNKKSARDLASRAVELNPGAEGAWLILAAVSAPDESIRYLQNALDINPNNLRAVQGLQWARLRVKKQNEQKAASQAPSFQPSMPGPSETPRKSVEKPQSDDVRLDDFPHDLIAKGVNTARLDETRPVRIKPEPEKTPPPQPQKKEETRPLKIQENAPNTAGKLKTPPVKQKPPPSTGKIIAAITIGMVLCLFLSAAVMIPFSNLFFPSLVSAYSAQGSILPENPNNSEVTETIEPEEQPSIEPAGNDRLSGAESAFSTPTFLPSITYAPSFTPLASATPVFTSTPSPSETPTITATPPPTVVAIPVQQSEMQTVNHAFTGRWIDVDLDDQMVYAYEDDQIVREFLVSTGTSDHPTVKGQFHIYLKFRFDDMIGPGYYLRDVPYVMYFYKGYGLHGTFWHDNFGTPMSHGCVNMRTDEAAWLYDFAPMGTLVNVH